MNMVQAERLLMLASFLERLPPERFNFRRWASEEDLNSCGTTACALGWATTIPAFKELGLCLFRPKDHVWVGLRQDIGNPNIHLSEFAERAAAAVFGVTPEQFMILFTPDDEDGLSPPPNVTAIGMAAHIRKCVAEWASDE